MTQYPLTRRTHRRTKDKRGLVGDYVFRVLLRRDTDVRRLCEVHVDEWDGEEWDIYVIQPRKGQSVKTSYHKSGMIHLKIGNSKPMFARFSQAPAWLMGEETIWAQSFENFSTLMPWKNEALDGVYEISMPPCNRADTDTLAEVLVGRNFDQSGWVMDGVRKTTVEYKLFGIRATTVPGLSVCVRVVTLCEEA